MLTAPPPPGQPSRTTDAPARMAWLDALRGVAALVVALHHALYYYLPQWRAQMVGWFDLGKYGVLVFFLVSGYVIPASLERRGDLRAFWIGRFFRIHPLLLTACAAGIVPYLLGIRGLRAGLEDVDPVVAILAHVTMLQDVLAVPNTLNVLWTLSYEMAFYLLVVAFFVAGVHRRSALITAVLTLAAVGLSAWALLPSSGLSRSYGVGPVVVAVCVMLVVALAATVSNRPFLSAAGGILGGLVAAALIILNGRVAAWEGLTCLAVMFAGTALHRAERVRSLRTPGLAAAGLVLVGAVTAGSWNAHVFLNAAQARAFTVYWAGSVVLAAATFAAGWAVRRRRMPTALTTLGRISFSVYLLHPVLLIYSDQLFGTTGDDEPYRLVLFVLVLLALSLLTYRWIELPAQEYGRHLNRRLSTRTDGGTGGRTDGRSDGGTGGGPGGRCDGRLSRPSAEVARA